MSKRTDKPLTEDELTDTTAAATEAQKDTRLKPSEFTILPWGTTVGDQSTFNDIHACGFNLAGFVRVDDLQKVSKAGLQCLVTDQTTHAGDAETQLDQTEIDTRVQALVKRVAGNQAVYGYYLRDEPGADVFPGLGRWAAAVGKTAPGALAYINLFPNYASLKQLNVALTYDQYLEAFIQEVKPTFISYDHYALMDDGSLRSGYFQNLESVRTVALKHGLPFWNIVLSNAHFTYAEPTPAGFRFQLYTTLAYGGRGISYFTYFSPKIGNYRLAPVDAFGHKTPTWDMLRDVNLQLHRLGPVYLTLTSINVFHHPEVPAGCKGIESSRLLKKVEGSNLLIGEFEGVGGQPFVIIVNKDLHQSTSFSLEFKEAGKIQRVSAYTGGIDAWVGEDCWLAAGQGMLLCLKKGTM